MIEFQITPQQNGKLIIIRLLKIISIFTAEEIEVEWEKDPGWGHVIVEVQVCV